MFFQKFEWPGRGEGGGMNVKMRGTEFGPAVKSGLLSVAFHVVYGLLLDWLK